MPAITIVNRHYPPNPGITGESAWDLARYLIEQHGIKVVIVHIDRTYDGGGAIRQPVGETHAVRTVYEGKNGLLRIVAGLVDGFLLIRRALRVRQGPLLIMTSPPMLPFWASLLLRRTSYWLWSMDLFPEGFAAEGKVSPQNPVYRWIIRQTYKHAPHRLIALGPRQAAHVLGLYNQPIPTTVLPCGVLMHQQRDDVVPAWRSEPDMIYIGYAGNVGQAHSVEFLKSVIRHLDPSVSGWCWHSTALKQPKFWTQPLVTRPLFGYQLFPEVSCRILTSSWLVSCPSGPTLPFRPKPSAPSGQDRPFCSAVTPTAIVTRYCGKLRS